MNGMKIEDNIREANNRGDAAVGFYTVLGYPSLSISKEALILLWKHDVTLFETALPVQYPSFELSDTVRKALRSMQINQISATNVLQTYSAFRPNLFIIHEGTSFGSFETFIAEIEGYVDGILVGWDNKSYYKIGQKYNIEIVQLVTPLMSKKEIEHRTHLAQGFVYLEAAQKTGGRLYPLSVVERTLKSIKSVRDTPVCCGFGIKTAQDVRRVASLKGCNGVLIGTQLLRMMEKGIEPLKEYVNSIVTACKGIKD